MEMKLIVDVETLLRIISRRYKVTFSEVEPGKYQVDAQWPLDFARFYGVIKRNMKA